MPDLSSAPPAFDLPSSFHAEGMVRAIEAAHSVQRRHQFFVWLQSHLHPMVPHQLAACGCYVRARKQLAFESFNAVPVPAPALSLLSDPATPLMRHLQAHWIESRGRSTVVDLGVLDARRAAPCSTPLRDAGFDALLVHGVARPQRPAELESLFVLGHQRARWSERHRLFFDLMLPHVHTAYLRVQSTEREMGAPQPAASTAGAAPGRMPITERERQILAWVREGKSNQEIGVQLDISALTVKNHVQKILRKLGAANRAQAVAMAMTQNLLSTAHEIPTE